MKFDWKTCLKLAISFFVLYLAISYWSDISQIISAFAGASLPLIIGCIIAYAINIPMSFYERHYFSKRQGRFFALSRRPVCMLGAFLTVISAVVLIVWLILPQLTECFTVILTEFPVMFGNLLGFLRETHILPQKMIDILSSVDWKAQIGALIEAVTSGIGDIVGSVISMVASVFSGIVTALLSIIFSIYLLAAKDRLYVQWTKLVRRYADDRQNRRIRYAFSVLNDSFHCYIVGQCTEAVIIGVLCTIGMFIFGFPYSLMIGALVAFTALIPIAGAYIGAGLGAFMILSQSPVKALLFLLFILILQQLEGNLIYPKVVGSSIGLPGIWVLAAVTIGGGIFGITGMLFGVPIAAAVYRIIREDVRKGLAEKNAV